MAYSLGQLASAVGKGGGDLPAIRARLASGAGPNDEAEFSANWSPLCVAAASDRPEAINALCDAGASVGWVHPDLGSLALHVAAEKGATGAIRALVRRGASLDARRLRGETALHAAVVAVKPASVRALLTLGADPSCCNAKGNTPADVARVLAQLPSKRETGAAAGGAVIGAAGGVGVAALAVGGVAALTPGPGLVAAILCGMTLGSRAAAGAPPKPPKVLDAQKVRHNMESMTVLRNVDGHTTASQEQVLGLLVSPTASVVLATARQCARADRALLPGTRLRVEPYGEGIYERWEPRAVGGNRHFIRFRRGDGAAAEPVTLQRRTTRYSVLPPVDPELCLAHQRLAFVLGAHSELHSLLPCDVLRSICDELRPPPQSLANEAFLSRAAVRHAEPVPETVIEAKTGRIIRRGRAQKKAVFRGTKTKSNSQAEGPQDEDGVDGALIAELGEAQASGDDAALAAAIAKINAGVRCAQV